MYPDDGGKKWLYQKEDTLTPGPANVGPMTLCQHQLFQPVVTAGSLNCLTGSVPVAVLTKGALS